MANSYNSLTYIVSFVLLNPLSIKVKISWSLQAAIVLTFGVGLNFDVSSLLSFAGSNSVETSYSMADELKQVLSYYKEEKHKVIIV